MKKTSGIHPSDLLGIGRLAVDGTKGVTAIVEALHRNIAKSSAIPDAPPELAHCAIPALVYTGVRAITGLVGDGLDSFLTPLIPLLGDHHSTPEREAALAVLNGVMGDHLAATHNPFAIPMKFRQKGRPVTLDPPALTAALPHATSKLVLLVHGLCMNDLQWTRKRHNHGTALARDLGYTPLHLHYNSGLHISTNGREFANMIETLVNQWPVPLEDFAIVAHSMGGLVSRSAYHYGVAAGHHWPRLLHDIVFLGTPHHGAPLERGGNWIDVFLEQSPYTSPFARLGKLRSAGITDLRYGNLLDDDWEGRDRFERTGDQRHPVPLPENVRCYAMAAAADGIVPVESALGRHPDPERSLRFLEPRQWTGTEMNHWDLLSKPGVYRQIRQWLHTT